MTTKEKIVNFLGENEHVRPSAFVDELGISQQMLHRHLKQLIQEGVIIKIGTSPKTFYSLVRVPLDASPTTDIGIGSATQSVIEDNFMHITPVGTKLLGLKAFIYWCTNRNLDVLSMAKQYKSVIDKYAKLREGGLIDATAKIHNTFSSLDDGVCVDEVFYVDFYALETFGKTKLGQALLYAKQSQDAKAIKEIADTVRSDIQNLIKNKNVDAVVFVPPTVKRTVQFMKVLEKSLAVQVPVVEVLKVLGDVAVPQKTLKNLKDRIDNANASFVILNTNIHYKNILIIDDAVGSGASINQIACKLKTSKITNRVIGVAITGSLNNFDVISEV